MWKERVGVHEVRSDPLGVLRRVPHVLLSVTQLPQMPVQLQDKKTFTQSAFNCRKLVPYGF